MDLWQKFVLLCCNHSPKYQSKILSQISNISFSIFSSSNFDFWLQAVILVVTPMMCVYFRDSFLLPAVELKIKKCALVDTQHTHIKNELPLFAPRQVTTSSKFLLFTKISSKLRNKDMCQCQCVNIWNCDVEAQDGNNSFFIYFTKFLRTGDQDSI